MAEKIIIIGASGHGKVIADAILQSGNSVVGFLDDDLEKKEILGFPVLGRISDSKKYKRYSFFIGIGSNQTRKLTAEKYSDLNYCTVIHPSAVIATNVQIGKGSCVMANAVVNTLAKIGQHCIINTSSIIEHDNRIDDYAHISPNATLGGTVKIGELGHIGIGAVIKNNIRVREKCVVGAGSVVVKNLEEVGTYVGIPAKRIGL